ncbi:MAG TPA: hypothetical protein VLS48_03590 [Anaerolineales bacterium]|nr:hypothetical protein [Anaerolineales bacterium]
MVDVTGDCFTPAKSAGVRNDRVGGRVIALTGAAQPAQPVVYR